MSDRYRVIDPRMFISPPFRDCPACGEEDFGVLMISGNRITRRCRSCWYDESATLPSLERKVVYLDQMVPSNIAKALDPVWRETRDNHDPYWVELFDTLDRLRSLQVLVCPASRIHEKESSVTPYAEILRRLYEHLASGIEFDFPLMIYKAQLLEALDAELTERQPDYSRITRAQVLRGDLNAWEDRVRVAVHFPTKDEEIEARREARDRSHDAFKQVWKRWQAETDRDYDDWYEEERRGMAETFLSLYADHVERLAKVSLGAAPITEEVWNPRLEVDVVNSLIYRLRQAGIPENEMAERVRTFLHSDSALDVPLNKISSLLFAALARKAAAGQRKVPSPGTWNDIQMISAFLPYCDAMFVDNQFAGLLAEEPLSSRITYPTKVFSSRTRDEFLEYLRDIEASVSPDHRELVETVYGPNWDQPFREILAAERGRSAENSEEPE